jgi:hypothetical protein
MLLALVACGGRVGLGRATADAGRRGSDAGTGRPTCVFKGFAEPVRYETPVEGIRLLPVDLNRDGKLDLVVGGWWDSHQTFRIFMNRGQGSFTDQPLSLPGAMNFLNMVAADFNGDGSVDLASQGDSSDGLNVPNGDRMLSTDLGDGRGGFSGSPESYPTPQTSGLLVAGDFDEDRRPDLAFAGNDFVEVYGGLPVPAAGNFALDVYRNLGDGRLAAPTIYASAGGYSTLVTGDFNGDGHLDVATDAFGVFFGRGDGTFQDEIAFTVQTDWGTSGLAVADFNGDGVDDIATVTASRGDAGRLSYAVDVFAGSRSGDFAKDASGAIPTYPSPRGPMVGDFNGDGRPDLAMDMSRDQENVPVTPIPVIVFENQGNGAFSGPVTYLGGGIQWDYPTGLVAADLNGDGVSDLVLATENERDPYPTALSVVLSKCE